MAQDWNNLFKPTDFKSRVPSTAQQDVCDIANEILRKALADALVVYADWDSNGYTERHGWQPIYGPDKRYNPDKVTHKARLVNIERIEK